jgi:PilZ domain-containing protein
MRERRRVPRQHAATWSGCCRIDGDPTYSWRECDVFDVSALGVGIDVRISRPSGLVARRISVRVPSVLGPSIDLTLRGEVRNASAGEDGVIRVGIEFINLSEGELYLIDLLQSEECLIDLLRRATSERLNALMSSGRPE